MEAVLQGGTDWPAPVAWLREFLKKELTPYPGRAAVVARMVIAATLTMLITMTFRLPQGFQGAIIVFLISRESSRATMKSVSSIITSFGLSAVFVLIGVRFSQGSPLLRLLWIIWTLFLTFYAISTMTDYVAAIGFGILNSVALPLWDMHISTELKVVLTLWACGQAAMGCAITLMVEWVFAGLRTGDDLVRAIAERLARVEELLNGCAEREVLETTEQEITRLGMVGSSGLRRFLQRSTYSLHYREQMGAVIALVGRLVDIAASLTNLKVQASENDGKRMRALAEQIASIRANLLSGKPPPSIELPGESEVSHAIPLLSELERTVSLIPHAFSGSQSLSPHRPLSLGDPPSRFFVSDALSNPEHIQFGLKGCLAASLCYIIYTAIAWPGISTSVLTCILTALTTIGSSRQKQILRIAGAIVGGIVIGMGAQVFILPHIDSIVGFSVLFVAVTIVAAWFATCSARLSYFGIQLALAFYLVNLSEFTIQTSLTISRDRVAGVLLGLMAMWLVFDQLWGAPASAEMKKALISLVRALAQLARPPVTEDLEAAMEQSYPLRETINKNFDKVRALADGVVLEFGPSREQDLALRSRILRWQPQLRMLFITRVTLLKFQFRLSGFELPEPVALAQKEFDESMGRALDTMADRLQGKQPEAKEDLTKAFVRLNEKVATCISAEPERPDLRTFDSLSRRMEELALSLERDIEG